MSLTLEYTSVARDAMTQHLMARVGRLFSGPCYRSTLFVLRGGFLTPCLRRQIDGKVVPYENPKLVYPVGIPVVGLAWEGEGRPVVLVFRPGCRTVSFLVEDLRQPLALAKEVASDDMFSDLEQVMAVSIPQRGFVLYVETTLPDGFGKRQKKDDSYLLAKAGVLADEIAAFVRHPAWGA